MKKTILFILFFALTIAFTGCNTVKGTVVGAATGFGKDLSAVGTAWQKAKKADEWLQKNAW